MRQYSNAYIIGFATAVCLVCSIVVSTSAVALRERQDRNKVLDRQTQVLVVAGLLEEGQKATAEESSSSSRSNIRIRVVDLASWRVRGLSRIVRPTTSARRPRTPRSVDRRRRTTPVSPGCPTKALVYQRVRMTRVQSLILPIEGKGLWSTLYGFIALAPDTTTIQGITFYEHGETPGLGGEVDNPSWKALWVGRRAYDDRLAAGDRGHQGRCRTGGGRSLSELTAFRGRR